MQDGLKDRTAYSFCTGKNMHISGGDICRGYEKRPGGNKGFLMKNFLYIPHRQVERNAYKNSVKCQKAC